VVFRILPHPFRAKARAEGPRGKRALRRDTDPLWKRVHFLLKASDHAIFTPLSLRDHGHRPE